MKDLTPHRPNGLFGGKRWKLRNVSNNVPNFLRPQLSESLSPESKNVIMKLCSQGCGMANI